MKKLLLLLAVIVAMATSASAQKRTYHGAVIGSNDDEPLIGATVKAVGSSDGVLTNADGEFTISVPSTVKQITVSYVGMKPATVALSDNMKVFLDPENTMLDQVVVTGYGSGKKLGSVVGAVSVVGEKVFENTPSSTFVDALQGQVAGLSIFSNSGDPSSVDNEVLIRGLNSLHASTTPLYILDGAPVSQTVFTTLNPSDIENITVLKDAASVAIYGSRAANGVIVITSKKGRFGEDARVSIRANVGWGTKQPSKLKMMNSQQLLKFGELVGQPFDQEIYDLVDTYGISTDWSKEMFHTALTYSLEAAVQGGSDKFSYYLSLNHYDQDGIITQSGMHRETLRFSLESKVKDWLRIGFQGNLGYTKYETNGQSDNIYNNNIPDGPSIYTPSLYQYFARPWDSPYYYTINDNDDMVYHGKADYLHYTGAVTPDYLVRQSDYHRNRVTANVGIYEQITPIKGLTLRAQQSVDAYDSRLHNRSLPRLVQVSPMGDQFPTTSLAPGEYTTGLSQQSFARYYQFTYTNTAEYRFKIAEKHNIAVLLGQESIISKSTGFGAYSSGHTDIRKMLLDQGETVTMDNLSETVSETVMNSYFGNLNYEFDNRYFFDASIRRDGSSRFAPGHRWGTFFSAGARWNIKGEKFLENVTWLNELAIRGNYGTIGNSGIPNYLYFGAIGPSSNYGDPELGSVSGNGVASPGNTSLTWETTKSYDIAVNFRIFDRVSADIDFYKKTTSDMLMKIPWSYTTGFNGDWGNVGTMTNTGVEVDVNADLFKNKDWYVGLRANFSYNKNEITELFDGLSGYTVPNTGTRYEVGKSASDYYYVKYAGVDSRDGKQLWYTPAGNITKVFNEETMAQFLGKEYIAPWNGGFGVDVRWKGIGIRADFNWSAKKYLMNNDLRYVEGVDLFIQGCNQSVDMLNIWTTPGQVTDIPAATEDIEFDSRFIEDASFMRLKNLTVSYALPQTLLKKLSLKGLTFHFTGRNLWTVTNYKGEDPEPAVNRVLFFYPNTRQYEFGFDVTF